MPKPPLPAAGPGLPDAGPRATIEMAIAGLIELLDALDGDPDLEPSLGWPDSLAFHQVYISASRPNGSGDAELDEVDFEDDEFEDDRCDDEGSLGASCDEDQSDWGQSDRRAPVDAEFDDSEREADTSDLEPNLAGSNGIDQRFWSEGLLDDREATGTIEDIATYAAQSPSQRAALHAVERQIAVLAARIRGRRPSPRRTLRGTVRGPDGKRYTIRRCD